MNLKDYSIEIPIDHLIPRIPQRLNYVLWIEDLLERTESAYGIDIGCGSSCVFSLLACGLNKNWQMLTSDMSSENIDFASKNISSNNLDNKIKSSNYIILNYKFLINYYFSLKL